MSTNDSERDQSISPDGNWLAYSSDASGQLEVYVGPFADLERQRWRVSIDGGTHPLWALTGDELFYQTLSGELMVAAVDLVSDFQVKQVNEVFPLGLLSSWEYLD